MDYIRIIIPTIFCMCVGIIVFSSLGMFSVLEEDIDTTAWGIIIAIVIFLIIMVASAILGFILS